jgi:hypothetical protein
MMDIYFLYPHDNKANGSNSNLTYCTGLPEMSERYCTGLPETSERYVIFFLLSVIDSMIFTFLLCTLNYHMLILTLAEVSQESLLAEISLERLMANILWWKNILSLLFLLLSGNRRREIEESNIIAIMLNQLNELQMLNTRIPEKILLGQRPLLR